MVRFKILNKDIHHTSDDDQRLEIAILNDIDDQVVQKFKSGKMNGKFSTHIERSNF
jgi:hypothetical protein